MAAAWSRTAATSSRAPDDVSDAAISTRAAAKAHANAAAAPPLGAGSAPARAARKRSTVSSAKRTRSEEPNRASRVVHVDVVRGRRGAEAGHLLDVAT